MKEFLFFAVFTFIMTIGVGVINAIASEIENPDNIQEAEVETFDLNGNIAQEKEIVLEDGTEGTLGIMPIIDERPLLKGTYSLANGTSTWKIYWYSGVYNCSFNAKINVTKGKGKITSAYNPWYQFYSPGLDVKKSKLSKTSSGSSASYVFDCKNKISNWNVTLKASVSGKKLTTSFK
ncbi:TPA: DUF5626 family protein [Listeria monocytogenes]|uniref:DUF5626 domain-containing protein n=1 Tax=Listeria monocytogenes TaxID=1639 RepID=A0A3T2AH04_LISMN|nr:DUF5626 family protein [Listeria monocytogenes]EAF3065747.1 hypothetical protein [Listeria monocytogenes serotype 1/2a]EAF4504417.1 hypothetical protein [Listeria monocytogenes serotype 4b]AEO40151.1 conserved hypothetical protein [Listeria monocytogenes Finland 1998]AGR03248.1 hypothetical protein M642_11705 [Listeria monocytogenes]ARJ79453.1 hypothetical protein UL92_14335 [Listeria monocytogenes]